MARLIDADALKKTFQIWNSIPDYNEAELNIIRAAIIIVEEAPTVDAAPVVHGRWLVDENPHDGDVRCSQCSACIDALHERHWPTLKVLGYTLSSFYPYCPQCGAQMDGGKDDG